jgi:hypothetical protein
VPERKGTGYPAPFDAPCAERVRQRLGNAGGLTDFGVNLMRLPPGNWSSQRHWHEDEFVYVLEGELTLIEDGGETVLRAGDCAAFPKGSGNGHRMINKSGVMAVRSRFARAGRPYHLLRHRHDERQRRRPVRAQGRHALSLNWRQSMSFIPSAVATAAAFAGAAAYINLLEQPARLGLDDISLLKEWKPSYAKGLEMHATLGRQAG